MPCVALCRLQPVSGSDELPRESPPAALFHGSNILSTGLLFRSHNKAEAFVEKQDKQKKNREDGSRYLLHGNWSYQILKYSNLKLKKNSIPDGNFGEVQQKLSLIHPMISS